MSYQPPIHCWKHTRQSICSENSTRVSWKRYYGTHTRATDAFVQHTTPPTALITQSRDDGTYRCTHLNHTDSYCVPDSVYIAIIIIIQIASKKYEASYTTLEFIYKRHNVKQRFELPQNVIIRVNKYLQM